MAERTWAVYALLENREDDHDLRFLGKVAADEDGHYETFHRVIDELVKRITRDIPRDAAHPDRNAWEAGGWEAIVCWPEDQHVQIDPPHRRGVTLGYMPTVRTKRARF